MIEGFDGVMPVVHASAWVHPAAVVIGRVSLGANVSVWPNATLRGDEGRIMVGANSNIQDGTTVHMTGGRSETIVGERVTVGHNCILHGCVIEDDVLIGMGSIVLDNARIGAGSYLGAATLVTGDKVIPPGSLVFGNPMRIVRACGAREAEWIAYAWQHYIETARKHAGRGVVSQ
jgi:carbonic anhydrase/acetyltransferase-like protein (isoleucine patch superfamily)